MPTWRNGSRHKVPFLNKKLCTWYLLRARKPVPSDGVAPSRSVTLQVRSQAQKQLTNTKQTPSFLWNSLSYYWTIFVCGLVWFCCFLAKRERGRKKKREERKRTRNCVGVEVWKIWEAWGSRKNLISILYEFLNKDANMYTIAVLFHNKLHTPFTNRFHVRVGSMSKENNRKKSSHSQRDVITKISSLDLRPENSAKHIVKGH